jgi:hypothetical protein
MTLPIKPPKWANRISTLLQAIQQATGESMYPVRVQDIAADVSKQFFPDAPITRIRGEDFQGGFEGAMIRIPQTANQWGILYNTAIKSPGRVNFTLAHELGHYLLHRMDLAEGKIECKRQDMFRWDSEHGKREAEANEFASYLLMPRNIFEGLIKDEEITLHLMQHVADHFNVSLTAVLLKWLQFTNRRAMLVVGDNGYVKWVWSSERLRKSGVFLQPKKELIDLPAQSLAVRRDATIDGMTGIMHKAGTWLNFKEDVREMTVIADSYEMTITLLLFPDDAPNRWVQQDEEPELMDTFEKFQFQEERSW